jgi:hypothetical protein
MSGINRQILADVTKRVLKGTALKSAIGNAFSPKSVASTGVKTQELKKKKK